ncbi:WD repeat domain phosphoinositide-interacting protein 1 isoform X2 [Cottoperca gobio]|uniref:WD repeat domain phosphoinositide-interacting protein 1 isoform X2 n=1 Tax=Cottoperca gobio TaxID=56716 RepID=A0A6J2Q5L7_COTGO|nr:WD repeat domain phosphoinositide-interacting protein 1-like isoform X2 [Cottoperca gobio]
METGESNCGPGGPDGPALQFGCASFNQDSTSLALGTKTGYKLFSLTMVEKLDCIHECDTPDVYIVERLFSSSLVVVVSTAIPQRMNIYHFKKGTEICNYSYPNNILAVKLNRQRLVVCLEESIYIHNIKDMKLLKTLLNTPSNTSGLCALSVNHSNSYLAYPGSATFGEIIVYDSNNLNTVTMIPAHDSPLAALTFNSSATKLASASERGTVIRVFSIPEGLRLFEFRRGMKRYVNISSLSFSPDGLFLCASSNTETVHIFKLEQLGPSGGDEASWTAYVGKMFSAASSYLPVQVSGMMSQDRAFATVHLVTSGQRNVCTLAMIQKLPRLLVATADGQLFIYNVNPLDGGECMLAHKHRLFGIDDDEGEEGESEGSEVTGPAQACPSYAATAALPASGPITATLTGYSEDGGEKKGEVIPEHEFAAGPVCLDDENEFPPINWCRDGTGGGQARRS